MTPRSRTPRARLFIMMLLQFFVWGAWLPMIFGYLPTLGFTPAEQSWILNAFPIAAIVGLFFSNQFADRHFSAERFLAFSHLIGGAAMLGLTMTTEFWPFMILMWLHCLLYAPTISITNSIAFANMQNPESEFGPIRMGGTIGWVLAAWPFAFIFVDYEAVRAANTDGLVEWIGAALANGLTGDALRAATPWTFRVAGLASLILAVYSLFLPHTPARKASDESLDRLAWLEAVKLLKHPFILVLWVAALADSFVHNAFFNWAAVFFGSDAVGIPGNWIMPVMSIGQIAEILTMLFLGMVLKKLGWRATLIVGILGYAVRFAVFAWFPDVMSLIILVNLLHGICYAFFFGACFVYADHIAPKDIRNSAQSVYNYTLYGFGPLLARGTNSAAPPCGDPRRSAPPNSLTMTHVR